MLSKNDGSVIHGGIGVVCEQPDVSTRAALNQYPWALSFKNKSRVSIDAFRCSSAWNGVDATQNTGGAKIGTMEIGAFNEGLNTDGALDFWHAETLHFWPFGITTLPAALNNIYYDGETVGPRFGKTDGLDIKTLSSFRCKVITESGIATGPIGSIGSLQCDGNGSSVEFGNGHIAVSNFYSTSNGNNDRGLICTDGELIISGHDVTPFINSTGLNPYIECLGGNLIMTAGFSRATTINAPNYKCSSGKMTLGPVEFTQGASQNRTVGFIQQTGGRLTCLKPRFRDNGGATGNAITVTGGDQSSYDVDSLSGWPYDIPASLGSTNFSFFKNNTTTPTLSVSTPGDINITYNTSLCKYTLTKNYIDFTIELNFDTNAYTSASGALLIDTEIPHVPAIDKGVTLELLANVSFGVNQFVSGTIDTNGKISIRVSNSGAASSLLTTSSIPPSTNNIKITLSGRYKAA
tara:strand:+ start:311 stop:1699 length:1389 start_codon:yes stop_codon:yes gene_type:complete